MLRIPFASIVLGVVGIFLSAAVLPAQTSSAAPPGPPVLKSAYGQKLRVAGLPNGGQINAVLFRGAQPQLPGLQALQKMGVTTVVDLRGEDRDRQEWERKEVESLGMKFVSIPISGWAPPSNDQIAQFLSLFHRDDKEKIFVHCRYGDDRTGVFVATYRMAYDGWPANQALNEMYFFGFNGFWHPSMKSFIRDFPARLKSAPSLAALLPATAQTATN